MNALYLAFAEAAQTSEKVAHVVSVEAPFYLRWDFWIGTILGVAGVWLSWLAFREAQQARAAAVEAGKTVNIQTIIIELSEISQRLENIDTDLDYPYARSLLSDARRRLQRQLATIQDDKDVSGVITELFQAITAAKETLTSVRPTAQTIAIEEQPGQFSPTYNALEGQFEAINAKLGQLIGLLSKRTIDSHH